MTDQFIPSLELDKIAESKTNPRKTFLDIEQLAEDVKKHGLLQPLLVRPHPKPNGYTYELVFGARRYRAAKKAGLAAAPVLVRQLDDETTLEVQIVENLQRSDVHAMEEAEGFERLHEKYGRTVEEIATRSSKSAAYVYGRLKLCALGPEARKAFYEGVLTASTALYVARVPKGLQADLLKDIQHQARQNMGYDWLRGDQPDPLGARAVFDLVHRKYMLRLKDAPFDTKDASLVPSAGPCSECPKRTGNQAELFADVTNKETCTDPTCFAAKKAAHAKRLLETAKAEGKRVATAKEVKELFPYRDGELTYQSDMVKLDTKCEEDPKRRTFRTLLKGSDAPITVAQDESGNVHELASKADVAKALRDAGVKGVREKAIAQDASAATRNREHKKAVEKAKKHRQLITALIEACVDKATATAPTEAFWTWLVGGVAHGSWHDVESEIVKRRGLDKSRSDRQKAGMSTRFAGLAKEIHSMNTSELRGLLVELVVTKGAYFSYRDGLHDVLVAACKLYGVDPKKVEKGLEAGAKGKLDATNAHVTKVRGKSKKKAAKK